VPPETAAVPQHGAGKSDRVARILARYGNEQPLDPDRAAALAQEVEAALDQLAGAQAPAAPARPPSRGSPDEPDIGLSWGRRMLLAAVAAALIALFWHRLAWFG
jgi:hypothetical protein